MSQPYYLRSANHGGMCCGIKHIFHFPDPYAELAELAQLKKVNNKDRYGENVSTSQRFAGKAAPGETAIERLDRILAEIDTRRPSGCIEVTLTDYQKANWLDALTSRGFRLVTRFKNSNSGNMVNIFHRVTLKGEVVKDAVEVKTI